MTKQYNPKDVNGFNIQQELFNEDNSPKGKENFFKAKEVTRAAGTRRFVGYKRIDKIPRIKGYRKYCYQTLIDLIKSGKIDGRFQQDTNGCYYFDKELVKDLSGKETYKKWVKKLPVQTYLSKKKAAKKAKAKVKKSVKAVKKATKAKTYKPKVTVETVIKLPKSSIGKSIALPNSTLSREEIINAVAKTLNVLHVRKGDIIKYKNTKASTEFSTDYVDRFIKIDADDPGERYGYVLNNGVTIDSNLVANVFKPSLEQDLVV